MNPVVDAGSRRSTRVLVAFIAVEFLCQLALLVPTLNAGALRVLWRVGIFALSIAMIGLLRGRTRSTAVSVAAFWVMALMTFELLHPDKNTWLAALADWGMYLAVLGPVFWMSRLQVDGRGLRRILRLFWGFYSISATVGILQVYYPGRFQPPLSPFIARLGPSVEGLKILLPGGATIFRPMGLTDTPGGAATAGMWAVLLGLGFLLTARAGHGQMRRRGIYLISMMVGMSCIYLSQVRVLLVVTAVWFAALLAWLAWRRRWRQFAVMAAMAAIIGGGGFLFSARLGGAQVRQRTSTLAGSSAAAQTFSQARGLFVRQTIHDLIPNDPLGAGLGRWGMMNVYFGNSRGDPRNDQVYVEIQWQAWVLDGGVPMLIAYLTLIGAAMLSLARTARRRGPLWIWAALCLAYDVSVMAMCFDSTPFTGEQGLEFWFINALILAATVVAERRTSTQSQEAPASIWTPMAGVGRS